MDPRMVSTDFVICTSKKICDEYPGLKVGYVFGSTTTYVQFKSPRRETIHRIFENSDSAVETIMGMYSAVNQIPGGPMATNEEDAGVERTRHITFLVALAKKLELQFSNLRIRVDPETQPFTEDSVYVTVANEHRVRGAVIPSRATAAESLRAILDLAIHVS